MRSAIILLCLAAAALSNATPIPAKREGYWEGNPHASTRFELFYDLLCSDSKHFHPNLKAFLNTNFKNGTFADYIHVVYHHFPLPYHTYAFVVA